ncbi:LytTR family DNA-binding domain-containing protein [Robertmurraya massiliosenegalensis]|uniref:LytTR family DNA-binding domain-containing protein n=1 Tax=Robertmurraya TaxID=2837507 RepID=UPI0039A49555
MKIKVEHTESGDNEIILRCKELDDEMLEILSLLRDRTLKIVAKKEGEVFMLLPNQVFYVEAVDGNTFLYTEEFVFETHETLSQLEMRYEDTGFIRIGKSQLMNLHHVEKIKSLINSRIEVTLKNGEMLIVSRRYKQVLLNRLGIF